jgi:hypothetical protein
VVVADPTHEQVGLSQAMFAMFAMKQNLSQQAGFLQMPPVVFKRARDVGFLKNIEDP